MSGLGLTDGLLMGMSYKSDVGLLICVLLFGALYLYEPVARIIDHVLQYALPVIIYGVIICTEKRWITPIGAGGGSNISFILAAAMYLAWLIAYLATDHQPPLTTEAYVLSVISLVGMIILAGYLRGKCWLRS